MAHRLLRELKEIIYIGLTQNKYKIKDVIITANSNGLSVGSVR